MTQVANRVASVAFSKPDFANVSVCVCVVTGLNQLAGNNLSLDLLPSQTSSNIQELKQLTRLLLYSWRNTGYTTVGSALRVALRQFLYLIPNRDGRH